MNERDQTVFRSATRHLVYQTHSIGFEFRQRFDDILDFDGDVMNAAAALFGKSCARVIDSGGAYVQ